MSFHQIIDLTAGSRHHCNSERMHVLSRVYRAEPALLAASLFAVSILSHSTRSTCTLHTLKYCIAIVSGDGQSREMEGHSLT